MDDKKQAIIKFAVCVSLLLAAYIPTIIWMYNRWIASESYYGHGFLIPIISLFIAWQRRESLRKSKIASETSGIAIVASGVLIHIFSAALKIYFISGFSFVFVLYGLILFCFGKEAARNLIFPVFFLLAMIPLPLVVIGNLTVKLKLFVAQIATFILNRAGFPSMRDGSIIRMPNSFIAIEAPCSGLRSIVSLLTLGLVFSYTMKVSYLKKSILFISSLPIAVITNVIRVTVVAMVNDLYGEKIAMGAFHDFSGYVMFAIAFAGLYWISRILSPSIESSE